MWQHSTATTITKRDVNGEMLLCKISTGRPFCNCKHASIRAAAKISDVGTRGGFTDT